MVAAGSAGPTGARRVAMMDQGTGPVDVLVIGAGPTGLALSAFGATVRVVDRRAVLGRESRALVVQPHRKLAMVRWVSMGGPVILLVIPPAITRQVRNALNRRPR
jgi:phytoene dehydrogenase-like protein